MAHRNRRRKGIELDGILLVDKPQEWTSHDVVNFVKGRYRLAKAGHGGTLDPMATGLLVLLFGKATKCSDRVMAGEKVYEGELTLGVTTDSQDREGEILETRPLPPELTPAAFQALLPNFTGEILQVPPMVSALKKDGVPLYKLARQGKTIEREPRPVTIHELEILRWAPPVVGLRVRCGKGTYVRTLAHDLGESLGCGAHLSALRRTRSGSFSVEDAVTVDTLREMDLETMSRRLLTLPENG